jgi:hypothetical protein
VNHNGIDWFLESISSLKISGPLSRTSMNLKETYSGYLIWRLFSFLTSKSFEVGEPGLAGLANAPRAAERASPKDVKVKAFMTTACTFGYLGSRTGVLEKGFAVFI